MATPVPETRSLVPPAAAWRSGASWDALITVLVGVGLLVVGGLEVRSYRAGLGKMTAAFRLANVVGDTRVREDEFFHTGGSAVRLGNMSGRESADGATFRHGYGPEDTVEIWSDRTMARLDFAFRVVSDDQVMTVAFNGEKLEEIHGDHELISRSYPLKLHPGANEFTIGFTQYNHHGIEFHNQESRPLAGTFEKLNLFFP